MTTIAVSNGTRMAITVQTRPDLGTIRQVGWWGVMNSNIEPLQMKKRKTVVTVQTVEQDGARLIRSQR